MGGVRQKRAMLLIRKSVPIVTRAVAEEELFFITGLSMNATELGIERLANSGHLTSASATKVAVYSSFIGKKVDARMTG